MSLDACRSASSASATSASRWRCGWPPGPAACTVYDVAPEPLAELAAGGRHGGRRASPSSRASVDLVCVMVRDDDQVREVRRRETLGRGRAHGPRRRRSTRPSRPTRPAQLADVAGRTACASSTRRSAAAPMGAAEGTLAIMVGGDDEAFAALRGAVRADGQRRSCTPARSGPGPA